MSLLKVLTAHQKLYYNGADEIMPNYEWDALFDELTQLKKETGYIVRTVRHRMQAMRQRLEIVSRMSYPALSLARQRVLRSLRKWAGDMPIWLSWKLDGLTLVLTYDGGRLVKILTRGNGTVGSNITFLQDA